MTHPIPFLFRFTRLKEMQPPSDIVNEHDNFRAIYKTVCAATKKRASYLSVLGDFDPAWSLTREKELVGVIIDLVAAGSIPEEKLGLSEFVTPSPIRFITREPPVVVPVAKRVRTSRASNEGVSLLVTPRVGTPTGRAVPLPACFRNLISLQVELDLGKAAIMEVILVQQKALSKHVHRADANEFDLVLWRIVSEALIPCTFESPLACLKNRRGLRASQLGECFNHFDRCRHFSVPNTRASQHRSDALAMIKELKLTYKIELAALGVPPPMLAVFDTQISLVMWFSRRDALPGSGSLVRFEFSGSAEDDAQEDKSWSEDRARVYSEWLQERKPAWFQWRIERKGKLALKMEQRRKPRTRDIKNMPDWPTVKPWYKVHPRNGQPCLTLQGAAIIRLLRSDGRVSKMRQPVVFSLMYTFFFMTAPPTDHIPSAGAMDMAERQLSACDKEIMIAEIKADLEQSAHARFYSLFDDTHFMNGERHVYFLTYFHTKKETPVPRLVSLKPTPGKNSGYSRQKCVRQFQNDFPVQSWGFMWKKSSLRSLSDHHSMTS